MATQQNEDQNNQEVEKKGIEPFLWGILFKLILMLPLLSAGLILYFSQK